MISTDPAVKPPRIDPDGIMLYHLGNGSVVDVNVIRDGTDKGTPSLAWRFNLPGDERKVVLVEMTATMLDTVNKAVQGAAERFKRERR